ncbi:MAG: ABC transporter permease [Treponema sp.]|jgi:phospholipid/cholesterol/gamma-HCH transport system permease protein|nr:ABC transporter permease [Treponema sp.]
MLIKAAALREIPYALGFFVKTLKGAGAFILNKRIRLLSFRVFVMQLLFTFVEALGIISLLALGIGTAVNAIVMPFLARISQERYIYILLIAIIMRELGPLLTAFIVIARSATAIATELAGMVISHEVEAYISVGVDPIEYLAVPRFLGVTVSLFLLNIYFSIFGLGASFAAAWFFNPLPPDIYFASLLQALNFSDIIISMIKSVFFGMIIAVMAILRGFSVERASTEVPVAGLKAVGASFAWCILLDIILSVLYYAANN